MYYLRSGDEKRGPFRLEELSTQGIRPDVLVWRQGMTAWDRAENIEEIHRHYRWPKRKQAPESSPVKLKPTRPIRILPWAVVTILGLFSYLIPLAPMGVGDGWRRGEGEYEWTLIILSLPQIILWCHLHHQCWQAIPQSMRYTTPTRAVGFAFVPFFQYYWAFITWPKLSQGYFDWQRQRKLSKIGETRTLSRWVAASFVFHFTVVCFIPNQFVRLGMGIVESAVCLSYYRQIVAVANRLREAS